MARIYQPREIQRDGRATGMWRYTVASDEETWPAYAIGYCAGDCPGHDSPDGAIEHQHEFEIDTATRTESTTTKKKCQVCAAWTTRTLQVGATTALSHWVNLCSTCDSPTNLRAVLGW